MKQIEEVKKWFCGAFRGHRYDILMDSGRFTVRECIDCGKMIAVNDKTILCEVSDDFLTELAFLLDGQCEIKKCYFYKTVKETR